MSETISPNTTIAQYSVISKIGEGGMGEVYRARDTKLGRDVAIKVLPAAFSADAERLRRFEQEAQAAGALNHPHILTIYEIGTTGTSRFIATEFIDGETLRQRMRNAPLKLGEVLDVAAQIASALSAAHGAGIIHRDIKPENIMRRHDGIVKVLDFGLAKLTERSPPDSVDTEAPTRAVVNTDPGMVMGTAIYMSPEQARGMAVDARTDIFSLGIVLYEMVAGCLPFEGSTSSEVLASLLSEKEPQPLARYSREAPGELERIVSKTLRKNRDERYQTIKDMLLDLKSLKQELEFEKKLERSVPPKSTSGADTGEPEGIETVLGSAARPTLSERGPTTATKLNQRSAVIAVAALLVIASAAGAYFYFTRARSGAINSIAVLPFVNASGNADVEYLSDGLTESLITSLSQLPRLSVKGRSSVFRYKGKEVAPQQVGKELNVQAIVSGRVAQRGNDFTLHIELVDVNTETALWSGDYGRSMTNLVSLQSEIARDISSKLRLKLSGTDEQRLAKNYTANTEAYQLYLQGRYYQNKRTEEGLKKSIQYFQEAIAKDSNYALAYTGLADSYSYLGNHGFLAPNEASPKGKAAALKALEIDDTLAEAHTSLGYIRVDYDWDWASAEKEFKRAIELNPSYTRAHSLYAASLGAQGRFGEAHTEMKQALEPDPLSLYDNTNLGWYLYMERRYDDAIAQYRKTLDMDPNYAQAHLWFGQVYEQRKMYSEAIAEFQKAIALYGGSATATAALGHAYAIAGNKSEAQRVLNELKELSKQKYVSSYDIAVIYAGRGDKDQVFAWLEKAYVARDGWLAFWVKVDPRFDEVRPDPRFADLLRRVGHTP